MNISVSTQNGVLRSINEMPVLIIPLPCDAFKAHAAFFQYPRGRGIAVKHLGLHAVEANLVKGILQHGAQHFRHDALPPADRGEHIICFREGVRLVHAPEIDYPNQSVICLLLNNPLKIEPGIVALHPVKHTFAVALLIRGRVKREIPADCLILCSTLIHGRGILRTDAPQDAAIGDDHSCSDGTYHWCITS